jgi:DNA repair exonuclease SbcCD nuclease subunit
VEPTKNRSSDLVGNFVDLVKSMGVIYAGHIHKHKEFIAKGRRFVFVGSPYQQTLGEIGSDCGYYVLDDFNRAEFRHVVSAPKHVQIPMSKVADGSFDFSAVRNSIIQKVYDVDIDQKTEANVSQRINDFKPYEELLPDYRVSIDSQTSRGDGSSQLELIRKSKIEYMRNYVDNIQQAALDEQGLDREKLFNVLERYYAKVAEG